MAYPQSHPTSDYTELDALTNRYFSGNIADNVFDTNMGLKRFVKKQNLLDGGTAIEDGILYNDDYDGSYSGMEPLETAEEDSITVVRLSPKQHYQHCSIDGLKLVQNKGKAARGKLIYWATRRAKMAMEHGMGTAFYADGTGNGSKDLTGLGAALDLANDGDAAYGGLTQTWWAANVTDIAGKLTVARMITLWGECSRDGMKPTLGLTKQVVLDVIENLLDAGQRYVNTKSVDAGIQNITFHGMPIEADSHCSANGSSSVGDLIFLNEKTIKLHTYRERNFKPTKWREPHNADGAVMYLFWAGNLLCNQRRANGALTGITG
jgi:hypothetical protein